jgi:hypothetical protein
MLSVSQTTQSVSESCGQILDTSSTYQTRKNVHINMCPGNILFLSYSLKNAWLWFGTLKCCDRWIDNRGPTAWPPRWPDLNPLDFHLWEHLKTLAYAAPVDNEETLDHRIVDVCHNCSGGPWWDVSGRTLNLMEDILITYFKGTLWAVTHILMVSRHMFIWTIFLSLYMELASKICPHLSVIPCIALNDMISE